MKYKEGWEKAIKPGPNVELYSCGKWTDKTIFNTTLYPNIKIDPEEIECYLKDNQYSQPIEVKEEFQRQIKILKEDNISNMNIFTEILNKLIDMSQRLKSDIGIMRDNNTKRLNILSDDIGKLNLNLESNKEEKKVDWADTLRQLIIKYHPPFKSYIRTKQSEKYDVKISINEKYLSILFPEANTEWAGSIMKAVMEFREMKKFNIIIDNNIPKLMKLELLD